MPPVPSIELGELGPHAVGELLTLQRAAYVTEAQLYDDVRLPALVQTLDELVEELGTSRCLAAFDGARLVGAVRTRERDGGLHVGRLVVAPTCRARASAPVCSQPPNEGRRRPARPCSPAT